jgi:hypothetical protein
VTAGKPVWTTASFLLYAGGLTVLGAALAALAYLSSRYGDAAYTGWALLILVVLYAIAHSYKRRDRWIAAGIFAFASVIAWAAFVGAAWTWFGWLHASSFDQPLRGFSVARLSFELLVLAAVFDDSRRFRFPFITAIGVVVGWLFVTDLLSGGGSWSAVVTLFVGFAYMLAGAVGEKPSAFWLHLGAGLAVGGALLYWWHSSDANWALISVAALVYVAWAYRFRRSSYAVLAFLALLAAGAHFTADWTTTAAPVSIGPFGVGHFRGWVPSLVYAFVGFLLVVLGLRGRQRDT